MAAAIKAQFGDAMELKELARPDASGELKAPSHPLSSPLLHTHTQNKKEEKVNPKEKRKKEIERRKQVENRRRTPSLSAILS